MGIFKDMLYTGVRKREAQEEYERNHPSRDYSGGSSGTRRVKYKAYCKICGAYTCGTYYEKPSAISQLQSESNTRTPSKSCGQNNHLPETEEVNY